ncbi:hypothetical protein Tco_1102195 [Tanacetum coccineum]
MQIETNKLNKQMANLTDMWLKFVLPITPLLLQESGTLPGNTVTNPREDLKGITTRSCVAYQGPQFLLLSSEANNADLESLILGRCFLKTSRALIDVHKGELTLRIGSEAITYQFLDQTSTILGPITTSPDGKQMTVIDMASILNSEPPPPLPNHKQYMPGGRKELKLCEAKTIEPSVHEPPSNSRNCRPISDNHPKFCTHKILMEEDYTPAVQHQRRVNPKIHDVIKKEVEKLLEAGLIYPISDSPWVSPVHCVPKKGGITVVVNEENELIPTRLVTGWRVCIDYRKLNEATRKDHFPLPSWTKMLRD